MMSLEAISEALTHSDQSITKVYINTKNTLKQTAGETAFRFIKKRWGKFQGNFGSIISVVGKSTVEIMEPFLV